MAIAGDLTWIDTTATVRIGQTVTVAVSSGTDKIDLIFEPTAEIVSATTSQVVLRGLQAGEVTIPAGTTWTTTSPAMDMVTTNSFTLTVLTDEPKVATESQWADLASRIKAKSDVQITMTTTDPGEGASLAANSFIAVYNA